jgi:Asp-tRNA(Asn)/Glu-tRNA(Gln) amidotransferase A subunit family amidase
MTSTAHTPAWRLAARMANKEISPLEVMRETLDRIDRVNPGLNAFVSLRPEAALGGAGHDRENCGRKTRRPPGRAAPGR